MRTTHKKNFTEEKIVKRCPYLREWLIASCVAEEPACVVMPFVLRDYCTSGKFNDCSLQPGFQAHISGKSGAVPIS
jgi:hypothetical protein